MLSCQRDLFDLPDEITYLNCAYMSPLTKAAVRVGAEAIARKAHPWQLSSEDFFTESERARALFAQLINASADDIAIIPAVSYGIGVAAKNIPLKKGDRILTLEDQFPSNVYPWRIAAEAHGATVVTLPRPADEDWTRALLEALDDSVAVCAIPQCLWTDGSAADLVAVGRRCRAIDAAFVLDVTQSLGAVPLDIAEVQPDYLVTAGYKWLFGPYSLGYMYVAPHRQEGAPLEHNWIVRKGADDFARLVDYEDRFAPGARRYDVGERSNFALLPVSIAGLEMLLAWGPDNIAAYCSTLSDDIAARAAERGLHVVDKNKRGPHFASVSFPDGVPDGLGQKLAEQKVFVSIRGNAVRITPNVYNRSADVDELFEILDAVLPG